MTAPAPGGASPSASSRATYLSTAYLAAMPPNSEISMGDLVAEQDRLADEARETMPYAFDECSYSKGYLRQGVWSCIDCGEKGVCYGCSISCHAEHKLVELWTRRHFRCDCPTSSMQPEPSSLASTSRPAKRRKCTLNPPQIQPAEDNIENRYSKNHRGEFCRCGREYDPLVETEGMICCIACEDWFHESCLNLRPQSQPSKDESADEPSVRAYPQPGDPVSNASDGNTLPISGNGTAGLENGQDSDGHPDDEDDDDDEKGVLIPSESYDGLICADCVRNHPVLRERAGTAGWMTLVPNHAGGFEVVGRAGQGGQGDNGTKEEEGLPPYTAQDSNSGGQVDGDRDELEADTREACSADAASTHPSGKRSLDDGVGGGQLPIAKKVKVGSGMGTGGAGDVFLAHGEREKLKTELSAEIVATLPFPLDDEEIYEPPKDEDKEETLDEMTARVVDNLPRAQAIEAVHGYQRLKDRLQSMLATHASDGRVVSKEDIEAMFEGLRSRAG